MYHITIQYIKDDIIIKELLFKFNNYEKCLKDFELKKEVLKYEQYHPKYIFKDVDKVKMRLCNQTNDILKEHEVEKLIV